MSSPITRAHVCRERSPGGVQPSLPDSHSLPFSHTASSTRLSFVSIVAGVRADGGAESGDTVIDASRVSVAFAGGIPLTASR